MVTAVHKLQGAGGVGGAGSYWIALAGTAGTDYAAEGCAVDSSGNVASVGRTHGTNREAVAVVRDADGTVVWEKKLSYSGQDAQFESCAFDSSGNLYAVGHRGNNKFIVKFDSSGSVLWQKITTTVSIAYCKSVIVDTSDNVFVSGYGAISGLYGFVAQVNPSTGALTWIQYTGATSYTTIPYYSCLAIDESAGMLYLSSTISTGSTYGGIIDKFSTSGTFQTRTYAYTISGSGSEEWDSIAVDSSGDLVVCHSDGSYGYISKLPNTLGGGSFTWTKTNLVSSDRLILRSITTDSTGNIYGCGIVAGTQYDGVIVKYNSSGVVQWANTIGDGTTFTDLLRITLDGDNTIIVTGSTQGDGAGGYDGITMRIPSDGTGTGTYGSLDYQSVSVTESTGSPTPTTLTRSALTTTDTLSDAGTTVGSWTYTEELFPI